MTSQSERKASTLRDVAQLAKVSTATVARVLHDSGYVSDERRKRVELAVAQTGYQINVVAQGLRKQKTLVIGHVLSSIASNPFFATVAMGVEEAASAHGCGVLTVGAHENEDTERAAVENLIRRRVDAVVFTTVNNESSIRLVQAAGIPVVQVERAGVANAQAVTVDNYRGSRAAVEHLIELGHQRIGYIGVLPPAESMSGFQQRRHQIERERFFGYRDALLENGFSVDENHVELLSEYFDDDRVKIVARRWVTAPSPVTAIFAAADAYAAIVLQEIYAQHLRVPDDVSLIGFDDTYGIFLSPPLTTVAQPMLELGRRSAELAIELVDRGAAPEDHDPLDEDARLATKLIVRDSTGPVRQS